MHTNERVVLSRDCEAAEVPSGYKVTLPAGSSAMITQALGRTYTLVTDEGFMVRIAATDADAIGKEVPTEPHDGQIRRRGDLAEVLEGLFAAKSYGLHPIKINAVIERGVNDDDIIPLVEFSRANGFAIRFIESGSSAPFGAGGRIDTPTSDSRP